MTRIVTVGIDGSRESLAAAGWAAGEAVARGELLRMVHVWSNHAVAVTRYEEPETHRRRAHGLLDSAARYALADRPGLRLETSLLSGDPVRELCAAGADADLLVLGSRGLGGLTGFITGSVSLAVLAHARRPVVLVRAGDSEETAAPDSANGEVVVGLGLPADDEVTGQAFAHAERRGGGLRVVHSWSLPPLYGAHTTGVRQSILDELAAEAHRGLEEALAPWTAKYPDVPVERRYGRGSAAEALVEASHGAALVVVGLRRRTGTWGAHVGPVVHAVIHHSAAPVAIVPHDAHDQSRAE
ncbi:universal stress protein [Streptomyces zhihengii]|uniref:universal stress protein n=1 Tax=Streptomyces zhihengii TaxID=1818004 RepID=UPI0036BEB80B